MSTTAPLQNQAAKSQPLSNSAHAGLLLQRKCACGSPTSSLTGECAECKNKKRLQTKLAIGASNDPLELEADRVANQVLAAPAHSAVSNSPPCIQRFSKLSTAEAGTVPASVDRVLASPGRRLEPALRQDMEQRFGHDFSQVRVHTGATAVQSAADVNAHAYTAGQHMVFGAGRFAPESGEGRRLLAHELTHVVQQSGGASVVMREAAGPEQSLYDRTKWKVYRAIIAAFKKAKNVSMNAMRSQMDLVPPLLQSAVGTVLDVVDFVLDMVIALMLVIIGLAVGFTEGIVKLIDGLIHLLAGLIKLIFDWFMSLMGKPDAYVKDVNALAKAIAGMPAGLKVAFDNWVERYKKATLEEQVIIGGELLGELEAFIATFALAGTKAGQATTLTIKAGGGGMAVAKGGALALQESAAVAVTIPAMVPKTLAQVAVTSAQMSALGGGPGAAGLPAAAAGAGSGSGSSGPSNEVQSKKVKGPKNSSEAIDELQVTQDSAYAEEASAIGSGIEPIEIQEWAGELSQKGYNTFSRNRFGQGKIGDRRLSSFFTDQRARPDMIAINEGEKTCIVGDVTARPGSLAKIPGKIGEAEGLHIEKTIEYAKQLQRQLPPGEDYTIFAQDIHWQTGTKTKLIKIPKPSGP